jgi:hypothetical protein
MSDKPNTELAKTASPSVAEMIHYGIERGHDAESMTKLYDLYERMEAKAAARQFAGALLAFQTDCPVISKPATVNTGKYNYDYAPLDYIKKEAQPHLNAHGLSFTQDSNLTDGMVSVTTIVRHIGGHEERTSFNAPIDATAKMNDTQKVASAVSYARRYGLVLALGITPGGEDDDGQAGGKQASGGNSKPRGAAPAPREKATSLPPSVTCVYCGNVLEGDAVKAIRTWPAKYAGKGFEAGCPAYKCEECGKVTGVVESKKPTPVPATKDEDDDLPF